LCVVNFYVVILQNFGNILIDAGYNANNLGDTDIDKIKEHTIAYTPVPGIMSPEINTQKAV